MLFSNEIGLLTIERPQINVVMVVVQNEGKRRSPTACTQNSDLHIIDGT
jgi:hypothetical protein